jgi:carbamoyltransferase
LNILGIWDGHDAGACIVNEKGILVAINEERITRRKLEVGFPKHSISACLSYLNMKPQEISSVAATTVDFAKTLTRCVPSLKENYYHFRRRKTKMPPFVGLRKNFKHFLTEIPEVPLCRRASENALNRGLSKLGFKDYKLSLVGHHEAHAAAAAIPSGLKKAAVITLDGVGDGLSGTVNIYNQGVLERISSIKARDSFGLFFEQVTDLLGMRELEDEGKVMALSNYAFPVPEEDNKLMDFFKVEGLEVKSKYSIMKKYSLLKKILWNTPREELAYMAQATLEKHITELFQNTIDETGIRNVCWSGGVASNIKVNLSIRMNTNVKKWFVFPHMGDGGLAVGAALYQSIEENSQKPKKLNNAYLGPEYSNHEIESALKRSNLKYEERKDAPEYAGEAINSGEIILWYQSRMELGPRALGNRSILAPSDSLEVKDRLNLQIKKRNWFQPFCPSLLQDDAKKIFKDVDSFDKFMTMGYMVEDSMVDRMKSVINVDNSARPQMLGGENKMFKRLLQKVKKGSGYGVVLNTSYNLHGYPIVNSPEDAIDVFIKTGSERAVLGDFVVYQNG